MRSVRIGVFGIAALSVVLAGCGGSTEGTATAGGSSTGTSAAKEKSDRAGASSPKAAVQALIGAAKAGDQDKIDAVVCEDWPRSGKLELDKELDPPAQKAFPKSSAGEAKQDGDAWLVPVDMPGDSPISVKVVRAGKDYFACGFDQSGG